MLKLNNWDYFKFTTLFIIISTVFIMKSYPDYGTKGNYNVSEHNTESIRFSELGSQGKKIICNKNCERDCRANAKFDKISQILICLDSCSCNSEIQNVNQSNEILSVPLSSIFLLLLAIIIFAIIIIFYRNYLEMIIKKFLNNVISLNSKNGVYENDEDGEVLNDYKKLNDL